MDEASGRRLARASNLHPCYFLDGPKLVRFLVGCASPSLSSLSFFFVLFALLWPAPVLGVDCDPWSRSEVANGVGAWDAGVEPGVDESWPRPRSKVRWAVRQSPWP